jgi:uncharacterized protein (TIGR02996 family)
MDSIRTLLEALERNPADRLASVALADALEEGGEPLRAELLRLDLRLRDETVEDRPAVEQRLQELLLAGVRPCLPTRIVEAIDLQLVLIPPGSFWMGSPPGEDDRQDDEAPQVRVTSSRGFWMSAHAITQAQWEAIVGRHHSHFHGPDLPVDSVLFEECRIFCEWLQAQQGVAARLPTEAEWEYACRAGTTSVWNTGETLLAEWANYDATNTFGVFPPGGWRETTTPVGSFPPNAWGLYDMHGNVFEWCSDWYGDYPAEPVTDPTGPSAGSLHILRGGSWWEYAWAGRSARRFTNDSSERDNQHGFRIVVPRL